MKRKSKFFRPKMEDGGLLEDEGLMGGIGAGASALTSFIPSFNAPNQAFAGDQAYMKEMEKAGRPAKTLDAIGTAGLSSGNPYAMAGGLILKGVSKFVGKGAARRAGVRAQTRKDSGSMEQSFKLGALSSNAIPKFQAPAYGRFGMKIDPKKGPLVPSSTTNIQKPVPPQEAPRQLNDVQKINLRDILNPGDTPAPWNDPERRVMYITNQDKYYIDDRGNLKLKPTDGFQKGGKLKFKSKFNRE